MRRRGGIALIVLALLAGGFAVFLDGRRVEADSPAVLPASNPLAAEPIQPLTPPQSLDVRKVGLGERLFRDPRLSHDNTVACVSCHGLDQAGVDHRPTAVGIRGQRGEINTPTVFNAGFNFVQFWDGRAATLEAQAAGPVHNPLEMGSSWDEVVGKLRQIPEYRAAFAELYRGRIEGSTIVDAIAVFERSLVTPDSRFDLWLKGDAQALTADEKAGYRLFKELGCASCHQGVNVGGNMYQKFGIFEDYRPNRPERKSDLGRFNVTANPADKGVFKVPSLRNIARTAPYFHDGSVADLPSAVSIMARVQLGRTITPEERRLLVGFLETLTGRYQGHPL